jgi:hypothetical protein
MNGGVQFRSKRVPPPSHEVFGFQADLYIGERPTDLPSFGCLMGCNHGLACAT